MTKKKTQITQGDIFTIPLKNGKYAIGIVAISAKNAILAYYFNKSLNDISEFNINLINKEQTILIQMVSTLGFSSGEWKLIGKLDTFNSSDWKMPNFKQYSDLLKCYYSISYNSNLEEVERNKIEEEEASDLYPSGMAGYIYAENVLSKLLDVSKNNQI